MNFPFSFLSYIYQEVGVKDSYNSEPLTDVKKKIKDKEALLFLDRGQKKRLKETYRGASVMEALAGGLVHLQQLTNQSRGW